MDYNTARALLRPIVPNIFVSEDTERWWSRRAPIGMNNELNRSCIGSDGLYVRLWDKPLLRIWDSRSGSEPDQDNRMLARAPRQRLDTREVRIETLAAHLNHSQWTPTPYISFTDSPDSIESIASSRKDKNRGEPSLTVINPRQRMHLGLPILHLADEMQYYNFPSPYSRDFATNHFLCLWEITPKEVVHTWKWTELSRDEQWYENQVLPALRNHQSAMNQQRVENVDSEGGENDGSDSEDEACGKSESDESDGNSLAAALRQLHVQ